MQRRSTCSTTTKVSRPERAAIGKKQSGKSLQGTPSVGKKMQNKGLTLNSPYIHPILIPPPVKSCMNGQENKIFLTTKQLLDATGISNQANYLKSCRAVPPLQTPPVSVAQYQLRKKLLQDNLEMVQGFSVLKNQSQHTAAENWQLVYRNRAFLSSIFGPDWNTQMRIPKLNREYLGKSSRESILRSIRDANENFSDKLVQLEKDFSRNIEGTTKSQLLKTPGSNPPKVKFGNVVTPINRENSRHPIEQRCQPSSSGNIKIIPKSSRNASLNKRCKESSSTSLPPSKEKSVQQIKGLMGKRESRDKSVADLPPMKDSILAMTFDILSQSADEGDSFDRTIKTKLVATASTPFEGSNSTLNSSSASVSDIINRNSTVLRKIPSTGTNADPPTDIENVSSNGNYTIQNDKIASSLTASPTVDTEIERFKSELQSSNPELISPKSLSELAAKKILYQQSKKIQMILGLNTNPKMISDKHSFVENHTDSGGYENASIANTYDLENATNSTSREKNSTFWNIQNVTRWVDNLSPTTGSSVEETTVLSSGVSSGSSLPSEYPGQPISQSESFLIQWLNCTDFNSSNIRLVGTSNDSLVLSNVDMKLLQKSQDSLMPPSNLSSSPESDLCCNSKMSTHAGADLTKTASQTQTSEKDPDRKYLEYNPPLLLSSLSNSPSKNRKGIADLSRIIARKGKCETGTSDCAVFNASLISLPDTIPSETFAFDDDNYFNYCTGTTPICRCKSLKVSGKLVMNAGIKFISKQNFGEVQKSSMSRSSADNIAIKPRRAIDDNTPRKKGDKLSMRKDKFEGLYESTVLLSRENQNVCSTSGQKPRKKAGRRVSFSDPIALWKAIPEQDIVENSDVMLDKDQNLRRNLYFRYPQKPEIMEY